MPTKQDDIYKYQPLWGKWYIEIPIGKGSYGSVYKIKREDMGKKYISAVKIISVPNDEQYREAEASFGNDEVTLSGYFEDIVKNIIGEIDMLYALSGNTNIVCYNDHEVIKKQGEIGWDILIRMEYVTSIRNYLRTNQMTRQDILKLGIDICSALETCSKKGIVHRDIKDENIFINEDGVYKLGDFGIAKELSKSGRATSMRGTPLYMAPEIFRGEKYDVAVDIYSLGIVLYKLLNNGRMSFMPDYPQDIKFHDSEEALEKRMTGMDIPLPARAGEALSKVVLKACSFKSLDRYKTPEEMKIALEKVLASLSKNERSEVVTPPIQVKVGPEGHNPDTVGNNEIRNETTGTMGIPGFVSSEIEKQKYKEQGSTVSIFDHNILEQETGVENSGHLNKKQAIDSSDNNILEQENGVENSGYLNKKQAIVSKEKAKGLRIASTVFGAFVLILTAIFCIYVNLILPNTLVIIYTTLAIVVAAIGLIGSIYAKKNYLIGGIVSTIASLIIVVGGILYATIQF